MEKNGDEKRRFFVAIELPEEIASKLVKVCDHFAKKDLFIGRCTRSENFHLTLKFLGEVEPEVIPEIDAVLQTVSFEPCDAHLGALDVLPTREKIRIFFAYLVCPEVVILAKQIEDALSFKFEREMRPFKSHVTIARIKQVTNTKKFLHELDSFVFPLMQWKINSFVLKSSVLGQDGPTYEVIKRYGG